VSLARAGKRIIMFYTNAAMSQAVTMFMNDEIDGETLEIIITLYSELSK
jgi:hypothetical protein